MKSSVTFIMADAATSQESSEAIAMFVTRFACDCVKITILNVLLILHDAVVFKWFIVMYVSLCMYSLQTFQAKHNLLVTSKISIDRIILCFVVVNARKMKEKMKNCSSSMHVSNQNAPHFNPRFIFSSPKEEEKYS